LLRFGWFCPEKKRKGLIPKKKKSREREYEKSAKKKEDQVRKKEIG